MITLDLLFGASRRGEGGGTRPGVLGIGRRTHEGSRAGWEGSGGSACKGEVPGIRGTRVTLDLPGAAEGA